MSSVRTCPSCKWEYPLNFHQTACRFCKTTFETQFCLLCKEYHPTELFYVYKSGRNKGYLDRVCKPCSANRKRQYDIDNPEKTLEWGREFRARRLAAAEKLYEDWMTKVDIPFKPLTEEQWIETCRYFDGCAVCGDDHIEARQFFVKFKEGGRYAAWNVFPTCSVCAKITRYQPNPFRAILALRMSEERREKMLEYFTLQIERVGNSE